MTHPIHESLLMDYAAGALDPVQEILVASCLVLSPRARQFVADCETLGGAMLEHLCDPVAVSPGCLDSVLQKIDCAEPEQKCQAIEICVQHLVKTTHPIPRPLLRLFAAHAPDTLRWEPLSAGIEFLALSTAKPIFHARILRFAPGISIGDDLFPATSKDDKAGDVILVLDGACGDHGRSYARGAMIAMTDCPSGIVADKNGCLCFYVSQAG